MDSEEVDPELLKEEGRANAIQDLVDQAESMGDRAVALERSTLKAMGAQSRRWRRTVVIQTVVIVILLAALVGLYEVSLDNADLLNEVDKLVTFVENVCATSEPGYCDGLQGGP